MNISSNKNFKSIYKIILLFVILYIVKISNCTKYPYRFVKNGVDKVPKGLPRADYYEMDKFMSLFLNQCFLPEMHDDAINCDLLISNDGHIRIIANYKFAYLFPKFMIEEDPYLGIKIVIPFTAVDYLENLGDETYVFHLIFKGQKAVVQIRSRKTVNDISVINDFFKRVREEIEYVVDVKTVIMINLEKLINMSIEDREILEKSKTSTGEITTSKSVEQMNKEIVEIEEKLKVLEKNKMIYKENMIQLMVRLLELEIIIKLYFKKSKHVTWK
jgi:hypothetical protein